MGRSQVQEAAKMASEAQAQDEEEEEEDDEARGLGRGGPLRVTDVGNTNS